MANEPMTVAMKWAERGLPSFPVAIAHDEAKGGTSKRPLTPHGHLDGSTDPQVVRDLFVQYGDLLREGEVLAAGMRPEGHIVADCDRHGTGDGPAYADSIGLNGTWTVDTASGGQHRVYRKPAGATFGNAVPDAWRGLIDVRADAGWIVCPGISTPWGSWRPRTPWDPSLVTELPAHVATMLRPAASSSGGWRRYSPERDDDKLHPLTVQTHALLVEHYGIDPGQTTVRDDVDRATGEVRTVLDVVRPGKSLGSSGTVGYIGPGVLYVFSTAWPGLAANRVYRPEELAKRAGVADAPAEPETGGRDDSTDPERPAVLVHLIDWHEAYTGEDHPVDWLVEGLLERGRLVAVYSAAKAGKSLLLLDIAAALATGRSVLGEQATGELVPVLYCDYENTPGDVVDRLRDLGYADPDELAELHYLSLPTLPPLDTDPGGRALLAAAQAVGAHLVIVDTASRTISGLEDAADTWLAWYTSTGMRFKRAGIALVRLDHSGKDAKRGQRGSSAKTSDVDLVLHLVADKDRLELVAQERRQAHYSERTSIRRHDVGGVLRHEVTNAAEAADGATRALMAYLDAQGFPPEAGRRTVKAHLDTHGHRVTKRTLEAALRLRKTGPRALPGVPAQARAHLPGEPAGQGARTQTGTGGHTGGHTPGTPGHTETGAPRALCPRDRPPMGRAHGPVAPEQERTCIGCGDRLIPTPDSPDCHPDSDCERRAAERRTTEETP